MLQTISVIITGKVQGVFYRQSTKEKAKALGITGFVENMDNGNVHIIATGTAEQLEQLTTWCKQGPPKAVVNSIDTEHISLQLFEQFSVQRS